MPIYEYRCDNGHSFEVLQRMTDDPVAACHTCEAPVQRVFHPIAVHFKGSGFYNTDYGTRKRQRENAAAGEGTSAKDAGSDSKKDGGSDTSGAGKGSSAGNESSASKSSSSVSSTAKD